MEIKRGINSKECCKDMWELSFNDEECYIDWYYSQMHKDENAVTAWDSNEVVGMMYENPYEVFFEGNYEHSLYLVGVAVLPERRGEGIMSVLLKDSLYKAFNEGKSFIFLTPADGDIYRKFGFGYTSTLEEYELDLEKLQEFEKKCRIERYNGEILDRNILSDLKKVYGEWVSELDFFVKRDENEFAKLYSETRCERGILYLVRGKDGKALGYMWVLFQGESIFLKEIVFLNREALETMLSILYGYKNYYRDLKIIAGSGSFLELYFKSQREITKKIKSKMQLRVVNVEKVLEKICKNLKRGEFLNIGVRDEIIFENSGVYKIKREGIQRVEEREDLKIDIENLGTLLFGCLDLETLKRLEFVKIFNEESEEILKRVAGKSKSYLNQDC